MQRRLHHTFPATYDPNFNLSSSPSPNPNFSSYENPNRIIPQTVTSHATNIGATLQISENLSSSCHTEAISANMSEISEEDIHINRPDHSESTRGIPWQISMPKKRIHSRQIYKAYCYAMAQFMVKPIAEPYLKGLLDEMHINIETFRDYIALNEKMIKGFDGLVFMLTFREGDSEECKKYKRVLRLGCEVFLKYFAVNWIFHSKMPDTKLYLEYRFKILHKLRMSLLHNNLQSL